jgi:hypothetical protein
MTSSINRRLFLSGAAALAAGAGGAHRGTTALRRRHPSALQPLDFDAVASDPLLRGGFGGGGRSLRHLGHHACGL